MAHDLEPAFLADILDHPADRAARLIYADWLEENRGDDPIALDRAAFIRAQYAVETLEGSDPAQRLARQTAERLLARHEEQWTGPVAGMVRAWNYRSGFIEKVDAAPGLLIQWGGRIVRMIPLRAVALRQAVGGWSRLMQCRWLGHVEDLEVNSTFHGRPNWFAQLLASPHLTRLRRLSLDRNPLPERAGENLGSSQGLPALEELALGREVDAVDFVPALAQTALARQLRGLTITGGGDWVQYNLFDSLRNTEWPLLQVLRLDRMNFNLATAERLALIPFLDQVRELTLNQTRLEPGALGQILGGSALGERLERLVINDFFGGSAGPADAVDLSRWPNLRVFQPGQNRGNIVMLALSREPPLPHLHTLEVNGANLRGQRLDPLLTAVERSPIRTLSLAHSEMSDADLERLVNHPAMLGVQELDLAGIPFTGRGAQALLDAKCLEGLLRLDLRHGTYELGSFRSALRRRFPNVRMR